MVADDLSQPVLIGQLTDTHVVDPDGGTELYVDNNARLKEAVESINAESIPLDVVLATGDLVNDASPREYEVLSGLLRELDVPLLPLPGNHDDRALFAEAFADIEWASDSNLSWVDVVRGVRIVGLDTIRVGDEGGEFDDERADWLSAVLSTPHDGLTMLAMHHPPFLTGIEWMDRPGFPGVERFGEIVRAGGVDRIVCGHVHRPMTGSISGVTAQVAMSTVHHVALELAATAQPSVVRDPVGYQIHRVADGSVLTHTRYIATGEKPFVPDWADEY